MWLPRETRDWIAHAAAETRLSQALILNALVNYYKLRRYDGTPVEKSEWYAITRRQYEQILNLLP